MTLSARRSQSDEAEIAAAPSPVHPLWLRHFPRERGKPLCGDASPAGWRIPRWLKDRVELAIVRWRQGQRIRG